LAASTRRWASVESADWSNRSDLADVEESFEAADGEEITNKIPRVEDVLIPKWATHEMCLIYADFKHFRGPDTKEFLFSRKVSSIMRAKVLSIMRANAGQVTPD
jgi:hypothetical protein